MIDWTRDAPKERGRYWVAARKPRERSYGVALVFVFGPVGEEGMLVEGGYLGPCAMPVKFYRHRDVWWSPAPAELPEPPKYFKVRRSPA